MTYKKYIEITNLDKSYFINNEVISIFQDLQLTIDGQQIISILGPSGCGKSTFLKLITGLIIPDRGTILVDNSSPVEFRNKNKVGYVFQKPMFFPWKKLDKNLIFPVELNGKAKYDDLNRVEELLTKFKLLEAKHSYPYQLSGGMLQRANVARALVVKPHLLLLDEPFNAIDEFTRERFWIEFRNIWKEENLTVIIVSHNIREAIFLGDRILIFPQKPINKIIELEIKLPLNRNYDLLSEEAFFKNIQHVRKNIIF